MSTARNPLEFILNDKGAIRSVMALLKLIAFIILVVFIFALAFHFIMTHIEHQPSSILTGIYWALTTMSTVGYGDIVFETDIGRIYSIIVLTAGIILLLVVLPFTFIRFFYGPWLEAQIHSRTPRQVPAGTKGHVILCTYDDVAARIIEHLDQERIPYFVIESDRDRASEHFFAGISVVMGDIDNKETYEALKVDQARMVVANSEDTVNTNIVLTVREVSQKVPVIAIANQDNAVQILKLSGATHTLPLKQWLGEQLSNRVNASHAHLHIIGEYKDLRIAELPVIHTPLVGKTIRESRLRENTGVSIIGVWERGRLKPALPDHMLTGSSVPVIVGTESQLEDLNFLVAIYDINPNPILVIGGGIVGLAAARSLKRKEIAVNLIEHDVKLADRLRSVCEQVFIGDATNPMVLKQAGAEQAPTVLLTSKDDALNIYLAFQCRQLNPEIRIVSRITKEHNIEAIHKAGADFVLGSTSLGIEAIFSILQGRDFIVLGEGVDLFTEQLPKELEGKTLAQSNIGARTGLNVIAVQQNGEVLTNPPPTTTLLPGVELLLFGDVHQRRQFSELYRD